MSHRTRYATLIDGAFAIRKLESRLHAFPTAADIESIAAAIARNESVAALSRLRVYFYHARPAAEILVNPINNERIALGKTQVHEAIVVVTGDSDLVPAFKFARREGLRVFLCHLGHGVKRELKAHADRTIRIELPLALATAPKIEEAA